MYKHHTKIKGDIGLGFIMANLLSNELQVALPISEHLPFDCIVINNQGEMCRLSVKYRAVARGRIDVDLRSTWSNSKGVQCKYYKLTEFDATAIYCPDTKTCYYVRNNEVNKKSINLRITKEVQTQKTIKHAKDFINPNRLFK